MATKQLPQKRLILFTVVNIEIEVSKQNIFDAALTIFINRINQGLNCHHVAHRDVYTRYGQSVYVLRIIFDKEVFHGDINHAWLQACRQNKIEKSKAVKALFAIGNIYGQEQFITLYTNE